MICHQLDDYTHIIGGSLVSTVPSDVGWIVGAPVDGYGVILHTIDCKKMYQARVLKYYT